MDTFTVSLAEIPIGICPLHPEMRRIFSAYCTDEAPLFAVATQQADIDYERMMADRKNADEPIVPEWNELQLEKQALLRRIANRIPACGAVLFHGTAVAVDGKAYLFTAPSGTGKTTHVRLWLDRIPQAYVLNGDKPFLRAEEDGRIRICGTPWRGKEQFGRNEILPLEAICLLERDRVNRICEISPKEALPTLLNQTHHPENNAMLLPTVELLNRICRGVRLFRLRCNMEPEAAEVSSRAMLSGSDENI